MTTIKTDADFLHTILATLGYAPKEVEPGKFHRFGPRKSGWAKLFADCMGGVFGDYRQGLSSQWSARKNQTTEELATMRKQMQHAAREREAAQRSQWARNETSNAALWAAAQPAGEAVRSYLAARGLAGWKVPAVIRQHPALAYWHTDDNGELHKLGTFPAMIAPIVSVEGRLLALHRTYLGNACKADVPTPKKLTAAAGLLNGSCIPLALPRGGVIGVCEGIETASAASIGSGLPVVAAYCANALASYQWPRDTERLVIFADNDSAGQHAAASLAQRATQSGLSTKILTPSKPGTDWLDVLNEGSRHE